MRHTQFIAQPLIDILHTMVMSVSAMECSFTTFPIIDYVLQATFLQMTGFQEQKMKLICWEIATDNSSYRYSLLKKGLGECSSYEEKNSIFKQLAKQICLSEYVKKIRIPQSDYITTIIKQLFSLFHNSCFFYAYPKSFKEWENITKNWQKQDLNYDIEMNLHTSELQKGTLFGHDSEITPIFQQMIEFRNRIAHNTRASWINLPSFRQLQTKSLNYENYFLRFTLLILVDMTVTNLFQRYVEGK